MMRRDNRLVEQLVARTTALYGLLLAGSIGVFLVLSSYGQRRWPSAHSLSNTTADRLGFLRFSALFHLLLALAVVALAGRLLAGGLRRFGQPPVMGEILAGIVLGPSLLGQVAPNVAHFVLPDTTTPYLGLLSQVGVIFFMFVVGLDLNASALRRQAGSLIAISHGSIVVPFLLGGCVSLFLYPRVASSDVSFSVFALFSGIAVAVTAFPVLSRILTDRQLHRSPLGSLALACASVDDITAWCLLAVIVGIAHADTGMILWTLGAAALYLLVMLWVARPGIDRLVRNHQGPLTASELGLNHPRPCLLNKDRPLEAECSV